MYKCRALAGQIEGKALNVLRRSLFQNISLSTVRKNISIKVYIHQRRGVCKAVHFKKNDLHLNILQVAQWVISLPEKILYYIISLLTLCPVNFFTGKKPTSPTEV